MWIPAIWEELLSLWFFVWHLLAWGSLHVLWKYSIGVLWACNATSFQQKPISINKFSFLCNSVAPNNEYLPVLYIDQLGVIYRYLKVRTTSQLIGLSVIEPSQLNYLYKSKSFLVVCLFVFFFFTILNLNLPSYCFHELDIALANRALHMLPTD